MAGIAAALALILMMAASPAVQGVQHIVGGDSHWTLGVNYTSWAAAQKFNVGDTLLFTYDGTHRVDEINEGDYNSCSFDAPLQSHNDGNTSISLAKAGKMYFACPVSGHCAGGMKFAITVAASTTPAPSGSPPATPSTPSPPSGSTTPPPSTTPSGTATPSPPPPPSGAASIVCSLKMFGVTALTAALLVAILG